MSLAQVNIRDVTGPFKLTFLSTTPLGKGGLGACEWSYVLCESACSLESAKESNPDTLSFNVAEVILRFILLSLTDTRCISLESALLTSLGNFFGEASG
jgi:hypothetical protein